MRRQKEISHRDINVGRALECHILDAPSRLPS